MIEQMPKWIFFSRALARVLPTCGDVLAFPKARLRVLAKIEFLSAFFASPGARKALHKANRPSSEGTGAF